MKKLILSAILSVTLLFGTYGFADEQSHKQIAKEFVILSMKDIDFEEMQLDLIGQTFAATMQALPDRENKQEIIKIIEAVMTKTVKKWSPQLEADTISITADLYEENFSEEELQALMDLFSTEIGRKYFMKQQILASQVTTRILPKTMGMVQELQAEISKALAAAKLK